MQRDRSNGLLVPTSNGRTERPRRQAPPQNPCPHARVSQSTELPISGLDPEPSEALRLMACFSTSTALPPAKLSRASPGFERGSRSVTRPTALPLILPQLVISQRHQSSHSLPKVRRLPSAVHPNPSSMAPAPLPPLSLMALLVQANHTLTPPSPATPCLAYAVSLDQKLLLLSCPQAKTSKVAPSMKFSLIAHFKKINLFFPVLPPFRYKLVRAFFFPPFSITVSNMRYPSPSAPHDQGQGLLRMCWEP